MRKGCARARVRAHFLFRVQKALDGGDSFTCTVRRGAVYDFQAGNGEA